MSRGTQEPLEGGLHFRVRGYHPLRPNFPEKFHYRFPIPRLTRRTYSRFRQSARLIIVALQPQALLANRLVWAIPISLATTFGITVVFSSSGY